VPDDEKGGRAARGLTLAARCRPRRCQSRCTARTGLQWPRTTGRALRGRVKREGPVARRVVGQAANAPVVLGPEVPPAGITPYAFRRSVKPDCQGVGVLTLAGAIHWPPGAVGVAGGRGAARVPRVAGTGAGLAGARPFASARRPLPVGDGCLDGVAACRRAAEGKASSSGAAVAPFPVRGRPRGARAGNRRHALHAPRSLVGERMASQEPTRGCQTPLTHVELGEPADPDAQVPMHTLPLGVPAHCPLGHVPLPMVSVMLPHAA
jgi:hypothetical protein